ncbi:hypothetical protein H4S06_004416 [Coemansia sp. BCRC 34490]|nr:hypothetical protein H4S06_004416 [Coemansia sp. BCRC 34490]
MAIKLITSDNQEFVVDDKIAAQSELVETFLAEHKEGDDPLHLTNVDGETLKKIIEYCEHHKDDKPYADEYYDACELAAATDPWDEEFINVEHNMLFNILISANYMIIKPLLNLGCKGVANVIKGKSSDEIRKIFGIEEDFTEEDKEQIRKEQPPLE